MTNPLIAICLFTYRRFDYAYRTVSAIRRNFRYDNYAYFIGDAGSDPQEFDRFLASFEDTEERVAYHHIGPYGAGLNWNMTIDAALKETEYFVRLEDDWELLVPLDPLPHLEVLQHENVGCIRWGLLPILLNLKSVGFRGRMYLEVTAEKHYMYSGNPHLTKQQFWDYFGKYPEGLQPGDTEVAYDAQVRSKATEYSPKIIWPIIQDGAGLFGHIGERQSYE